MGRSTFVTKPKKAKTERGRRSRVWDGGLFTFDKILALIKQNTLLRQTIQMKWGVYYERQY